jgi:hypothetical protein
MFEVSGVSPAAGRRIDRFDQKGDIDLRGHIQRLNTLFNVGRSMFDVRCSLVSFIDQTVRFSGRRLG